jgi:hypothetical protein
MFVGYTLYNTEFDAVSLIAVLGALLGTQIGRELEIVNTFELAVDEADPDKIDHGFLVMRRDQCKCFCSITCHGY